MCDMANRLRYCPRCNRTTAVRLDLASGGTVCTECVLVLGDRFVDESTEWRAFALEDGGGARDRGRVGAAADRFHGDGQQQEVTIAYAPPSPTNGSADAASHFLQLAGATIVYPATSKDVAEVAAGSVPWMRSAGSVPKMRGSAGQTLAERFHAIAAMAGRLGLTAAVIDRAKELLTRLHDARGMPKGNQCRNMAALYAACLHVACRAEGTPRTFKELAAATGDRETAGKRSIVRLVEHIKKRLGVAGHGQAVRAADYMRRFGSQLGMGGREVRAAEEAARRLEESLDVRRKPQSIAATIIYMASMRAGAGKSRREVAAATGVREGTIKEVYGDLSGHAELLFG